MSRRNSKRIDIDWGERLARARRILGWDQRVVAAYFGLKQHVGTSIAQWEQGKAPVPGKHLYRLKYMCDYAQLVHEERDKLTAKRLAEAGFTV